MYHLRENLPTETAIDMEVLELVCVPASPNPFGPVRNGHLRINGHVLPVTLWLPVIRCDEIKATCCDAMGQIVIITTVTPDVRNNGYEICVSDPHFFLIVRHNADPKIRKYVHVGGLIMRRSRIDSSTFERVGFVYSKVSSYDDLLRLGKRKTLTII